MYSVPMAIVDFIPVVFFGLAAFILQRDLYNKLSKGAYALFCAGTIDVFMAGMLKALYKLLYAAGACDFISLSQMFFPLQALGFVMTGMALVAPLLISRKKNATYAVASPVLFSGVPIFVTLMVAGLAGMNISLSVIAKRMKKPRAIILFMVSLVFSLGMGYLSTRNFEKASFNWIAEAVNCIGQGALFAGVLLLDRAGLAKFEMK